MHCRDRPQVPYYYDKVNAAWSGLWLGILYTTVLLVVLDYTRGQYTLGAEQEAYRSSLTWVRRGRTATHVSAGTACRADVLLVLNSFPGTIRAKRTAERMLCSWCCVILGSASAVVTTAEEDTNS